MLKNEYIGVVLILIISYIIYNLLNLSKYNKIQKIKELEQYTKEKKNKGFSFVNTDKVRTKLAQAGNPFEKYGINEYNYYTFKIIFTALIILAIIGQIKDDTIRVILLILMSWIVPDMIVRIKAKKRKEQILSVIPSFLSITIDGLQSGQTPQEIVMFARKDMPQDNPLNKELKILNLKLLKGNLKNALMEFKNRIGLEEIDNYCFSLLQYEIGGRAIVMLKLQLDMINSLNEIKKKRATQMKGNLSSIATALLVGALLIYIMLPLMANFQSFPLF